MKHLYLSSCLMNKNDKARLIVWPCRFYAAYQVSLSVDKHSLKKYEKVIIL